MLGDESGGAGLGAAAGTFASASLSLAVNWAFCWFNCCICLFSSSIFSCCSATVGLELPSAIAKAGVQITATAANAARVGLIDGLRILMFKCGFLLLRSVFIRSLKSKARALGA